MAAIGAVTCDFVKGDARDLKDAVDTWTVPGIDGYGAMGVGKRGSLVQFLAVRYAAAATVLTWLGSIQALESDVVSIVDDLGTTHTNILITRIGRPTKQAARGNFVGSPGLRGAIVVEGLKTA
jgi:hypothetical protein